VNQKRLALTALIPMVMFSFGCQQTQEQPAVETDFRAEALRLAQETLTVDTHIDLPYRLHEKPDDVTVRTEDGHFDLVRAREGGLDAAFMSIYVGTRVICSSPLGRRRACPLRGRDLRPADGHRKRRRDRG